MLPAQPNQSLIDGLACLQALAQQEQAIGVRALGRELGLEPTRTHRLLKTLAYLGLARQQPDRKYTAGPAIHVLSAQMLHASGLIQRAVEPLEELREHDLIVAMGVLWQTQVCYIYFADPGASLASALGSRSAHPATQSGIGMALLAGLDDAEIRLRYRDRPTSHFNGIQALLAAVREVRQQGYAVHEITPRARLTLAVPIGSPTYAAVGFSGRIDRRRLTMLLAALRRAAQRIEPTD
jgi:DNA-binding IclR family transcriptional regulator